MGGTHPLRLHPARPLLYSAPTQHLPCSRLSVVGKKTFSSGRALARESKGSGDIGFSSPRF